MPFPNINRSSLSGYGRFGYFNSHRSEAVDPTSGETIYTYDRCYTNEDMNSFMRGIVGACGLFNQSGTMLVSTPVRDRQYTACRVRIDPEHYILDDEEGEYPAGTYVARITPGKGLVNYHWFQIDNDLPIYFDSSASTMDRADKVSVRWDQNDRNCIVWVEKGSPNSALKDGSEIGSYGMIQNRSWETNAGFRVKTDPITGHTIMEITIGYMYIRGTTWRSKNPNKVPLWFRDLRGGQYCPWITHLVAGPSSKDLDEKIRQYSDTIEEWIANLTSGGDLGMKLSTLKLHVDGNDDGSVTTTQNIDSLAEAAGYEDYSFNSDHTLMVYYNGLLLNTTNNEYTVDYITKNITINNGASIISANNQLDIVIFVGSTLAIANGDGIFY